MNKTQFIQAVIARTVPPLNKVSAGIHYAENLWEKMTALGYGAPKQRKIKENKNWYKELPQYQREWFDRFWTAFKHPHGKQRAALAWTKIGEQTETKYKQIIEAAKAEANKFRKPSETRCMAERWLTEFRFEDHITKIKGKGAGIQKSLLKNEIKALEQFNSNGSQDAAIEKLKAELGELL